jgi:hypothetical protein
LHLRYGSIPGGWNNVARLVHASLGHSVSWFPDANVAILDETTGVWEALRLVALGSGGSTAFLTAIVREELREWLEDPHHHVDRSKALRDSLAGGTWARKFNLQPESRILTAILGYVRLLALRRFLARPTPDGMTMVATDPTKKSETMNAIGNKIGRRAQGLAKKGRIDSEKHGRVNMNDELHCLLAISSALMTGSETIILTSDSDMVEIFYKAQWFFDTHYRAWLAAPLIKAGSFGLEKALGDTHGFFEGPVSLYRRHTSHLREVLPRTYDIVPVRVVYVTPNRTIQWIEFAFERRMLGMLETRSETGGRCTDLFGGSNIHADLGPLKHDLDGLYFGIGRDIGREVETNDTKTFLARLDEEHSLNCCERFARRG